MCILFWFKERSHRSEIIPSFSTSAACLTLLFAWLILNQCCLTRHGKYWSSLFPMPKQPLTFFPQTKSSPRSAMQPSNISPLWDWAPAEPQHRAAAVWNKPDLLVGQSFRHVEYNKNKNNNQNSEYSSTTMSCYKKAILSKHPRDALSVLLHNYIYST